MNTSPLPAGPLPPPNTHPAPAPALAAPAPPDSLPDAKLGMPPTLKSEKLRETAEKICTAIAGPFEKSGLSEVAATIVTTTEEAVGRARAINGPDWRIRAGQVVLVLIAVAGVAIYFQSRSDQKSTGHTALEFLDAAKGSAALLLAAGVFLFTLERRVKRERALKAVHELRALAHLIDMHQLRKNPVRLGSPPPSRETSGESLDAERMRLYLHFCTELLAVVGKLGQLYVQEFRDAQAVAAVDQFENLATGLSSKIWQKLMILERVAPQTAAPPVAPAPQSAVALDGKAPAAAAK